MKFKTKVNAQSSSLLIILLHFTIICALKVIYIYYMVEMLYNHVLLLIFPIRPSLSDIKLVD